MSEEKATLTEAELLAREKALLAREGPLLTRERDVDQRMSTILARERDLANAAWYRNPVALALFGAIIALAGNFIVALANNLNTEKVQHAKAQSDLTLEAIKTGSINDACENLVFFVKLGFLDDTNGTIVNTCPKDIKGLPSLPVGGSGPPQGDNQIYIAVRDTRNMPVPGAKVRLQDALGNQDTCPETRDNGICRLPPLPLGDSIQISVEKEGYAKSETHTTWSGTPILITLHK